MEKVTIIGGGNGAFAAAADLTLRGSQVTLFELPRFVDGLSEVIQRGGTEMEAFPGNGLEGGFAKLYKITTNIQEALSESEIILVIVPSYSMNTIAGLCAPYLRDGQIVALCPANFGGALYFHQILKKSGNSAKVWFAEFACMMYACRKKSPSSVWVRGYKHGLGVALFPSLGSEPAYQRLQTLYPYITHYNNVIETGLSNINTTLHTSLMLLNAACIDNQEDRLFYRECVTAPSLDNLLDALNAERQSLNVLDGMNVISLVQIIKDWYGHQGAVGDTVSELQHSLPHFAYSPMPKTMDYRYVTEDVPYGLIPCAAFLEQLGFPHTVHTALADVLCAVSGRNFYQEARTMEELGIAGMDREQVMNYLQNGD